MKGFGRFPPVARAGIRRIVNGPFTFAPDGNPLVGPVRGVTNYWSCCGVMAGFSQGCGVALALSQWLIDGEPEGDIFAMDVSRFGPFATKTFSIAKAKEFYENRFTLLCPNDEWPAARPSKTSALHDRMTRANAVFGSSYGLEVPLWFAPAGAEPVEVPSFRRSNSHDPVGEECRTVRDSVGIHDGSSFAKYEIAGPDAEAFMDYVFASRLPRIGRIRMGPMLLHSGRMKGDLTVMRLADDHFMVVGSGYLQEFHMSWFQQHARDSDVRISNRSDELTTIAIAGPRSRELMRNVASGDVEKTSMPFMSVRRMDVGIAPCRVARLSFTGELGFEIYVPQVYAGGRLRPAHGRRRPIRNPALRHPRPGLSRHGEELWHLVPRVHAGLHPDDVRHGPVRGPTTSRASSVAKLPSPTAKQSPSTSWFPSRSTRWMPMPGATSQSGARTNTPAT